MRVLCALLAVVATQSPPPAGAPAVPAEAPAAAPAREPEPADAAGEQPAPSPPEASAPVEPVERPAPTRPRPARPIPAAVPDGPKAPVSGGAGAGPTPAAAAEGRAASVVPERVQVAAAARRFLELLLAGRAVELAAACSPTFSFDGRTSGGAEGVRTRWVEVLAARGGEHAVLLDLAVAPAAEAQAQLGKPPKRIASLLAPGSWVAVANLSGRALVIVFARHAGSWLATGIHG